MSPSEASVHLSQHSGSTGSNSNFPVYDVSSEGVAVVARTRVTWPSTGARVTLRVGEASVPCRAYPARQGWTDNGAPLIVLRLEEDEPHRRQLVDVYYRLRFPSLSRRCEASPDAVTELFRRSGYLALKGDVTPSDEWLAAPWPATLTREAVYTASDNVLVGHISVTRAYSRSWLGHEIATIRDHREALACRQALYQLHTTWPRLVDGDDAMVVGYYNRSRPWHQRLFEGYAADAAPDQCVVLPLDRFRRLNFYL
jgi:hypothetical protein